MTSEAALAQTQSRLGRLWRAAIGKKAIMAVTGIVLLLYLIGHMAGNLQIFIGAARINAYARLLRTSMGLLWLVRIVLLGCFALHVTVGLQLFFGRYSARPVEYHRRDHVGSPISSRTMIFTGLAIGSFVVFHVLNLTLGVKAPGYVELAPYQNVVRVFSVAPLAILYVAAILLLSPHLKHGIWSMTQSLGASDPRFSRSMQRLALVLTVLIAAGFISVPVAVLTGFVTL